MFSLQTHAETTTEVTQHLMNLINDARWNLLTMSTDHGMDSAVVEAGLGQNAWILDLQNGIPPLAWSDQLAASAYNHTQDMDENDFYDYMSFDGTQSISDRIAATGYVAVKTDSLLGMVDLNWFADPIEAADVIFDNLLKKAISSGFTPNGNFLDPDMTEIGISFVSATIGSFNGYLMVADMAKPEKPRVYFVGRCYTIKDDAIEWVSSTSDQNLGVDLEIFSIVTDTEVIPSDTTSPLVILPLGGYQIEIPEYFSLVMHTQDGNILYNHQGIAPSRNQMFHLNVTATSDMTPNIE